MTERLDRGLIDFAALIEPIDMSKYDFLRLPQPDTWGVLMRMDHPLAGLEQIRPEDLLGVSLIASRQMEQENGLSGWLGYGYEKLQVMATGNLVNTLALAVEEGVGCLLTLDRLVDLSGTRKLCFRPLEPKVQSWMYLVWKKYQVFTSAAEVFIRELRAGLEGKRQ